jgi:hypothetical protein
MERKRPREEIEGKIQRERSRRKETKGKIRKGGERETMEGRIAGEKETEENIQR